MKDTTLGTFTDEDSASANESRDGTRRDTNEQRPASAGDDDNRHRLLQPLDADCIEAWRRLQTETGHGGYASPHADAETADNRPVTDHVQLPIDSSKLASGQTGATADITWDPVIKPFNGARILTPKQTNAITLKSTQSLEPTEMAFVIDGLDAYFDNTTRSRIAHPGAYSKITEQFSPYIGQWTQTATHGAVGIDSTRLVQLIRLVEGSGRFSKSNFTVYGCGPNPAAIRARGQDEAYLVSVTDVRPASSQTPPADAYHETPSGLEVPEESAHGQRAADRLDTGFAALGLQPKAMATNYKSDGVRFEISEQAAGVIAASEDDSSEPADEANHHSDGQVISMTFGEAIEDDTPYVDLSTTSYRTAATGYGSVEALGDALAARPELSPEYLDDLPAPPLTPGDCTMTADQRPGVVLGIDFEPPTAGRSPRDITERPYGTYLLTVLAESSSYRENHAVKRYRVPATTRNRSDHSRRQTESLPELTTPVSPAR